VCRSHEPTGLRVCSKRHLNRFFGNESQPTWTNFCEVWAALALHFWSHSVNNALISPFCITQFFEWHFLHKFHRLTTSITPSLFHSRQKTPFRQILPTVAYLFFFRTDSTDSLDCLPIGLLRFYSVVFLLCSLPVLHCCCSVL